MKNLILILFMYNFAFSADEPFNYDPFVQYLPKTNFASSADGNITKPKPLTAVSVFLNKVFINGDWYKRGDKVRGYKVVFISPDYVRLRSKSKTKILPIGGKSLKILKIKDKK